LYSGYLSSDDDYKTNLEEDEEAATTCRKLSHLSLQRGGRQMLKEQVVLL
jgi:hypothetical protein